MTLPNTEPQMPEEGVALRALVATHRRWHRWVAEGDLRRLAVAILQRPSFYTYARILMWGRMPT
jgi:hypothetical protein